MYLKDKYEIVFKYLDYEPMSKNNIIHLVYIDHEDHKLYVFNTKINHRLVDTLEYEAGISLEMDKKYPIMIDTKPLQSELMTLDTIKKMRKKGSLNQDRYNECFSLIRKLKIDAVLDDREEE